MSFFKSRPIHTEFSLLDPENESRGSFGYVLASDRQLSWASIERMEELITLVLKEYYLDEDDYYDVRIPLFNFMDDMLKSTFLELKNDGTIVFIAFVCALFNKKVVNGVRVIRNDILKQTPPDNAMDEVTEAFRKAFHNKLNLLKEAPELA